MDHYSKEEVFTRFAALFCYKILLLMEVTVTLHHEMINARRDE